MSIQSQTKNMRLLGDLLSRDMGYIFGERESGPNGAKKQFLTTGRAFLSALGKDLGLAEQDVHVNKAGIAVSGEVYLRGMWRAENGLHLWLEQDLATGFCLCYRTIRNMDDHTGGSNHFISAAYLTAGNYESLLKRILRLKEDGGYGREIAA